MKKIILISVAVVVLLLVVGFVVVVNRLDGIVHRTVEREGTRQLNLATTLDNANISLFGGSLTLDELRIANPEGYTSPILLELGQVNVGVSYRQLAGDPVRVRDININSPRLVIERTGEGLRDAARINIRDLMERLDTGEPAEDPTRLIIDQLTVTRAQVVVRPGVPGLREEYSLTIPDIALENIGTADEAQNGAEIGRVAADVVMALAKEAAESQDLPEELRAILNGDLRAIASQYAQKLGAEVRQELQRHLGDFGGQLGTDLEAAGERLLEGDTRGAAEEMRQRAGDAAEERLRGATDSGQQEVQRGIGNLLGGRRQPTTQPATRPSDQ